MLNRPFHNDFRIKQYEIINMQLTNSHKQFQQRQPIAFSYCLLLLLLLPKFAFAAYTFQVVSGEAFDTVTNNVVWTNDSSQTGFPTDDDYQLVNIGFTFYLGETAYTQVRVIGNGALHFGSDQGFHKDYGNEALPITNACTGTCPGFEEPADRAILGYWDDLEPSLSGTVRYGMLGTAPNRRFIASWESVPRYNGPSSDYSFQIVIYENGNVRFRYGNDDANGTSATIGIEVDDTDYTQFSFNTNSVSDANDILWVREFPTLNAATADCSDTDTVTLTFASPISPARAADPSNFSIDNGINVLSSTYINSTTVELTTDPLSSLLTYAVSTTSPNQSVNFTLTSAVSATFLDSFNLVSYSENNGPDLWTGSWVEIQDDGTAGGGNIRIFGADLLFDDVPNSGGEPSIYREADLSGMTSATLSFDYATSNNLENGDRFDILASANGGASYTVIDTISNDATGSASYDISAYIATNTRIRFTVENGYGGTGEQMSIDNVSISASGIAACTNTIDHYLITHDGNGLTCETESITISACLDAICSALSTDSITLDFQADSVTQSSPTFIGSTSVNLSQTTPDTLTLSIINPTVLANNPLVCDSGGGNSCDITFVDTGFKFFGTDNLSNDIVDNIGNQIAGKPSYTLPGSQTIKLRAVQTNQTTGQCEALINNATESIGFAYECVNPNSCGISNNGMAINSSATVDEIASGYDYQSVIFDGTGTATIDLNYFDVGQIRVKAIASLAVGPDTVTVQGDSNNFIVRPFAYDLQVTGNPNATTVNDAIFAIAGNSFNTTVRSILWQSADDANNDGAPDIGATLSDNTITPNIANVSGSINLSPLVQIASNNGALGVSSLNFNSFSLPGDPAQGTATVTQSWSEVGIVTINSTTTSFMGALNFDVVGSRTNIGRFRPDHFVVSAPSIALSCGSFTYGGYFDGVNPGLDKAGQLFTVTEAITAENSLNATTLNYTSASGFAKLTSGNISIQEYNFDTAANDTGRVNFSSTPLTFINGVATYSDANSHYQFDIEKTSFNLRLDLTATDSDSVTGSVSSNQFEVRLGRLVLQDAFGPETSPLEMRLNSEYFDGTDWALNTNDSCTTYSESIASFDPSSYTDNLDAGETSITAIGTQAFISGLSTIGNGLWFTAPSPPADNYGTVQVNLNLTSQPWLQYDWDSDNTLDITNGTLNFGYYRGSDRVIYWQESN